MTKLNSYTFLPLTIIEAPIKDVVSAVELTFFDNKISSKYPLQNDALDLFRIYIKEPPAGGAHKTKAVLYTPDDQKDTTVFISNLSDGWTTLMHNISSRIHDSILFSVRLTLGTKEYPCNSLQVLQNGEIIRLVRAMVDTKWEFFEMGTLLDFEDPQNYKKRKIRDRVNSTIILDYLLKLGYDVRDDLFWKSNRNAVYIKEI